MTSADTPPHEADDVIPELRSYPPSLTPRQVAEVLGIGYQTVLNILAADGLPHFRVAGSYRVRRAVVQDVLVGERTIPPLPTKGQHG